MMEGTEKRIEKRFGLAEAIRDLRDKHLEVEQPSITYTGSCARAEGKPVWQEPSRAGSYNTITRPAHYARFAIQPIDFIEANDLDFYQASVLKYLVRYPFKNGLEDLHKARNMLDRLIAREEKKERRAGKVPELGMPYAGEKVPPYPREGDYQNWPEYMVAVSAWDAKYGPSVRNAGDQVGGQPTTDNSEDGAYGRYSTE